VIAEAGSTTVRRTLAGGVYPDQPFAFLPGKYAVDRFLPFALIIPSAINLRIGSARSFVVVPSSLLICSIRSPGWDLTNDAGRTKKRGFGRSPRDASMCPRWNRRAGEPHRMPAVSAGVR
jgi:hypothetical protein